MVQIHQHGCSRMIKSLCDYVLKRVPELIADLPENSKNNAGAAWRDYGEVISM